MWCPPVGGPWEEATAPAPQGHVDPAEGFRPHPEGDDGKLLNVCLSLIEKKIMTR